MLLCLLGFGVIFLGWNGAASKNVIMAQFPYLISGGIAGLAIVVIGAAMLIVQNAREDRARIEAALERLAAAVEAGGGRDGRRAGLRADGAAAAGWCWPAPRRTTGSTARSPRPATRPTSSASRRRSRGRWSRAGCAGRRRWRRGPSPDRHRIRSGGGPG